MNIKLVQTGGFLPVRKEASLDVPWSDEDFQELISKIAKKDIRESPVRDAVYYILEAKGTETSIDLKKIPKQHLPVFNDLKKKLTIMKF